MSPTVDITHPQDSPNAYMNKSLKNDKKKGSTGFDDLFAQAHHKKKNSMNFSHNMPKMDTLMGSTYAMNFNQATINN